MNKEEFWQTIESVNHLVPDGNQEAVEEKMCEELLQHSPQDILDWYIIFHEYLNAAYRNDLWAACTALGAHASDDGFIDFRAWLISQGKKVYMDAMRDPDTLAQNPHPGLEMNFEGFTYCPVDAYEKNPSSLGLRRKFRLYDDLDNHKLSEQVIKDIREEIPQRKDIPSNRLPVDYSSLFPHIWERMTGQKPQEAPEGDGLMTVHRMLDGTYQLHRTEVPDRLFEGAPPNILEYLEYCDLDGLQERLSSLLVPADNYHLCIITKCDEVIYSIGIIWGATHITDYIKQQNEPLCSGELSELVQRLSEMPYDSVKQQGDLEMELPF